MNRLVVLALVLIPSAGLAEPPAAAAPVAHSGNDPDQIVCRRQQRIGTRLDTTRVCMTRAQWAEDRRLTRESVDRVQMSRATNGQ